MIVSSKRVPFALLCVLMLASGACSDESGLKKDEVAEWQIVPENFNFSKTEVGQSDDRDVTITNLGENSKLAIKSIAGDYNGEFTLFWRDAEGSDREVLDSDGDCQGCPFVLNYNESLTLVLEWKPVMGGGSDGGAVVLDTNLTGGKKRIPVLVPGAGQEIDVSPESIDFGRVPAGTSATDEITISNLGTAPLTIARMLINGSQDFAVQIGDVDAQADSSVLQDPDGDGEPGLAPGESFVAKVTYAPEVEGPDSGELAVFSNDPRTPEVRVALTANGATQCIKVNPESVEFPATLINGGVTPRPISIESCGGEPLEIVALRFSDDSHPAFTLQPDTVPPLPALLPAYEDGQPPPSRQIMVLFDPETSDVVGGTLIIESKDPINSLIEVPLSGRGINNECPEPRVAQDIFRVLPLDTVTLDGSESSDPDGPDSKPVRYEWTVVERPEGSTFEPAEEIRDLQRPADGAVPDDPRTPTAQFFVDLAGTYSIELRVIDNLDLAAPSEICPEPTAVVTIEATPNEDIHVQMVWRTPGDNDETDLDGSDVDLHLLHPTGRGWNQAPGDCYYANSAPDWGDLNDPRDNPSLDIDDTNGAGPENINLDEPEDTGVLGQPYTVGVHYYRREDFVSDFDWGPSWVTVRIFLSGSLAWDFTENGSPGEKELRQTNHFWEAAAIIWTAADKRVLPIDRYYTSVP